LSEPIARSERLRVNEIFYSLQGEADTAGWPTVFVRLTGCPLRCHYCDTEYAFYSGNWYSINSVLDRVREYGAKFVCVTGGEPLAQPNCLQLLRRLCDLELRVSLETSGAQDISAVDARVVRVVDVKTPGSGEAAKNRLENFPHLTPGDLLKFVITSRADYDWSRMFIAEHGLIDRCPVLFSPSYSEIRAADLAEWILADRLAVRFQIQMHKVLWGEARGK
jgi:7-carboxy-7-deazaguanine synthase